MQPQTRAYPDRAATTIKEKPEVREAVTAATRHFEANRKSAYQQGLEELRPRAAGIRAHVLTHLEAYLVQAEAQLTAHGALVHWAGDAVEAQTILAAIVAQHQVKLVVKAKSMISEELGINDFLAGLGVKALETDLGEFIVQLAQETPSHIVGPAIHKNLAQIRELFQQHLGTAPEASVEELAAAARVYLRQGFLNAEMGISGANFLVAETGTLAIMENEGNIRLTTSLPKVHVALVGIERLLPRLNDLALFLPLTAGAATGQRIANYVSLIQGPRRPGEPEGPEEIHVILIDNGRSSVLADPEMWEALRCIRCGACLSACPVYRQTGGHAYGWVYSGPIGAILDPGLLGLEEAYPLPFASTLCGACSEACPVQIPIPKLLLAWRQRAVAAGFTPTWENPAMSMYAQVMTHPALYRLGGAGLRLPGITNSHVLPMLKDWNQERAGLTPSVKTFRQLREAEDG